MTTVLDLPTQRDLEQYIHTTLCELDHLDPAQAPLQSVPIRKKGQPCGTMFHVLGPRQLVYDSTGQRAMEVRLGESPELESKAA
jgi:hypothetical protein